MIHEISLAEVLEAYSPPEKVLNVAACDDTVFVRVGSPGTELEFAL